MVLMRCVDVALWCVNVLGEPVAHGGRVDVHQRGATATRRLPQVRPSIIYLAIYYIFMVYNAYMKSSGSPCIPGQCLD